MKKLLKAMLAAFLSATLAACSCSGAAPGTPETSQVTGSPVSDQEFTSFLDQYLIDLCEQDYSTAHQYFIHPENYGVDLSKCKITLGTMLPDPEDVEFNQKTLDTLRGWNSTSLSKTNRQIYEQLLWQCELSAKSSEEKYDYLGTCWSPVNGVPSNLVTFFSEYLLYSKADIDPLIELINDIPRYAQEAVDYSSRQAELGLFAIEYDETIKSIDDVLISADDSPVTESLYEEIDMLTDLSDEEKGAAKKKIDEALQKSFFPSFQLMKDGLNKLKSQNGEIKGLASYKDGKEAYELVLQSYSGTSQDPEEMRKDISNALKDCLTTYAALTDGGSGDVDLEPQTSFKSIAEIMPFLDERYPALFPLVDTMDYEIKPLAPEQSSEGVLAYFVVGPIDSTRPYEIRYNERDYGSEPTSLNLYDTFAHEGIPGHMYQRQYQIEHFAHPVQFMLTCMGMQEGYATYAAFQTLGWTGINKDALEIWKLSDLYSNYTVLLMDLQINYEGISLEEFEDRYGEGTKPLYIQLAQNPGIFFAYYYGCMKLLDLQTIAKEALGPDYDDVEFNNSILQPGNVKFEIIEESVQDYIDSTRRGGASDDSSASSASSKDQLPSTHVNDGTDKKPAKPEPKPNTDEQSFE